MNISKILALSMLCGVFASCKDYSDDIMADMDGTDAISFSAISQSGESRAAVADVDTLKKNGFKVYAYVYSESKTTVEPLIDGVDVEWETDKWTYSPIAFWPTAKDATVNFYAIYNDTTGNANTINGWDNKPHTTYTVNSDVMKQSDFLWAAPVLNATYASCPNGVTFDYKHALSGLTVKMPVGDVSYSIDGNTYGSLEDALKVANPLVGAVYKKDYIHSIEITGAFPQRGEIIPDETDINKIWRFQDNNWTESTYTLLSDTLATADDTKFAFYKNTDGYFTTKNGMLTVFPCGNLNVTITVNHIIECKNGDAYVIKATTTKNINFKAGEKTEYEIKYNPAKFIATAMKQLDIVPTIGIALGNETADGTNAKKQ